MKFNQSTPGVIVYCDDSPRLQSLLPFTDAWAKKANTAIGQSEKTVVVVTELTYYIVQWLHALDASTKVYACGWVANLRAKQDFYMYWFDETTSVYKSKTHLLKQTQKTDTSTLRFNALLGRKKMHRDMIYEFVKNRDDTVCSYMIHPDSNFIWEDQAHNVEANLQANGHPRTDMFVNYLGSNNRLSTIIPLSVYADTDWCIVAETDFRGGYVFFTEKTAKPIIAKKPFILVGHQYSLKVLHRLGFKTFHSVIDESYDNEVSLSNRVNLAMKQVDYLSKLDQIDRINLIDKLSSIVEHNYNVMMNTNWQNILQDESLIL